MSNLISLAENVAREVGKASVKVGHELYEVPCRYYRKNSYELDTSGVVTEQERLDDVYGVFSGQPEETEAPVDFELITIMVFGDLYYLYNQTELDLGMFADYKCYTKPEVVLIPQSRLSILREDGKSLNFRVEDRMAQGILMSIMPLWKLTYLED